MRRGTRFVFPHHLSLITCHPLLLASRGEESERLTADAFGDVAILAQVLEVFGLQAQEYGHRRRERGARVAREVVDDGVLPRPRAVHADEAQYLVGDRAHGGDCLDLLIRDARVVDDGLRDYAVRVANKY